MATAYTGPKLPGLTNGGKLAHGYRPLNLTLLVFFRVLLPNKRAEKTSGRPKPQAISPSSVLETNRRRFLFRLQLFFICRGATQRHYCWKSAISPNVGNRRFRLTPAIYGSYTSAHRAKPSFRSLRWLVYSPCAVPGMKSVRPPCMPSQVPRPLLYTPLWQ